MAEGIKVLCDREEVVAIADAVRGKLGSTGEMTLSEIASEIGSIEPNLQDKTVTPSVNTKVVSADTGYDGLNTVTVNGDSNLVANNIAEGVSIFGVTGTHTGGEDLDTVISEQATLISELSTILDNKASGNGSGSSLETCTVTITVSKSLLHYITATQYINGEITVLYIEFTEGNSIVLENVVCGSPICFRWGHSPVIFGYSISDGATLIYGPVDQHYYCFSAPITANANAKISLRDDD